jgi:hypothetical protein
MQDIECTRFAKRPPPPSLKVKPHPPRLHDAIELFGGFKPPAMGAALQTGTQPLQPFRLVLISAIVIRERDEDEDEEEEDSARCSDSTSPMHPARMVEKCDRCRKRKRVELCHPASSAPGRLPVVEYIHARMKRARRSLTDANGLRPPCFEPLIRKTLESLAALEEGIRI